MQTKLLQIIEAALLSASRPLSLEEIQKLFLEEEMPTKEDIRLALNKIESYHDQHFFDPCFVALIPCYFALQGLSQEAPHLLDLDGTAAAAAVVLPQDLVHTNIPKQVPGPIQKTRDKTSNEWHLGRRCPGKKEKQYCYFSR